MRHLALAILIGVALAGCNGNGDTDPPRSPGFVSTGNAAIDSTLPSLLASLRTGAPIEAAVASGSVANPLSTSTTEATLALGQNPQDGHAGNVNVATTATRDATGAETVTTRVTDPGTGFRYLDVTRTVRAPVLTVRVPPLGFAGVSSATGAGDAYVIVNVATAGTETAELANESGTKALVSFQGISPVPSGSASRSFASSRDLIVHYVIAHVASGTRAWVVGITNGSSTTTWMRAGGPATTPLAHRYSTLAIGGVGHEDEVDPAAGVGADVPGGVASTAPVNLQFQVVGGVPGAQPLSEVKDFIAPPLEGSTTSSINHTGELAGLTGVGDGRVQADQHLRVTTWSLEDPTAAGGIRHSLDGALGEVWSLEDAVYLPSKARRTHRILLFR